MCGIVGAVAQRDVAKILLKGLEHLEYRGYDSAGIATIDHDQQLNRLRVKGKVNQLNQALQDNPMQGSLGIAHTRWATHGTPSKDNAHPHVSGQNFAVVHNGIIDNHNELKQKLQRQGYEFNSATDSEVVVHLLNEASAHHDSFLQTVQAVVSQLEGAYALGVISAQYPEQLIAVRQGSPLVVGVGIDEHFIASDCLALLPVTRSFIYLEEGDIAELSMTQCRIYDAQQNAVERPVCESDLSPEAVEKNGYRHFMLKEIFEQPQAIADTLAGRIKSQQLQGLDDLGQAGLDMLQQVERIQIVACGTSYHAGMVAKFWFESLSGVPCSVDIASELRYRDCATQPSTLLVTISQSGETADTLAALRQAQQDSHYVASLCICNVPASSIVRESDYCLMTRAGVEIGVASTKAFTTQLTVLLLLALLIARQQKRLSDSQEYEWVAALRRIPRLVEAALQQNDAIEALASRFTECQHTLFLGRHTAFPLALEGALKLKEISYIHAEGYPGGELKHGPLALVDEYMPIITLVDHNHLQEKIQANIQEVQARGGYVIAVCQARTDLSELSDIQSIIIPDCSTWVSPIVFSIPMQLLAYHVAVLKGTDVDQPRNLAKSVTVE